MYPTYTGLQALMHMYINVSMLWYSAMRMPWQFSHVVMYCSGSCQRGCGAEERYLASDVAQWESSSEKEASVKSSSEGGV